MMSEYNGRQTANIGEPTVQGSGESPTPALEAAATRPREGRRETYRWRGPRRPDDTGPVFEVVLEPAPAGAKLEEVLEKDLESIWNRRLGWSCLPAEPGDIKGVTFARARWSISGIGAGSRGWHIRPLGRLSSSLRPGFSTRRVGVRSDAEAPRFQAVQRLTKVRPAVAQVRSEAEIDGRHR